MRTIYIDVDSLRPDHVGAYGYEAPTTPNIDDFAADAVRFERAYVANSPCLPSRAALLSGRYGIHNGVVSHGPSSQTLTTPAHTIDWAGTWVDHAEGRPWWTLPQLFYENRIPTHAVSSFPRHPAPWFHRVWHAVDQVQEPEGESESFQTVRAETVVDAAIDVLDEREAEDDCFLYVQLWDPHGPYNRTDEQVDRFGDVSLPPYPTADQLDDHQTWDAWHSGAHMDVADRDDLRELLAGYDAEIRYADRHLGRLLERLRERGAYEESLIVLTADHGEEFGEHGLYREHWSTHDGTQRVPLLVKPPADTSFDLGSRSHLVTNVDLPPTIADYADLTPPANWQGRSLRPVIEGDVGEGAWRDRVVLEHGLYTAQRAVRTDRWKYIRTYHPGIWSGVVPERQLFDMDGDPWEQDDLADDRPDLVDDLERELAEWCESVRGNHDDPLQEIARTVPPGAKAFGEGFSGVLEG